MVGGNDDSGISPLLDLFYLTQALIELGRKAKGERQAEGMFPFLRQAQAFMEAAPGLIRIPQSPQCRGSIEPTQHARVSAEAQSQHAMLLRIVARYGG
jgi:hypothetical protein